MNDNSIIYGTSKCDFKLMRVKILSYYKNKKLDFFFKSIKIFLLCAYKPYEDLLQHLESLMHMEKIMSTESEYWNLNNQTIPIWFYQMAVSMGLALTFGFFLILIGSL
tara:strand:- start:1051 stop:1374 length:324 start_codon:yes stop_codon:yes gene_type:complete